MTMPKIRRAQVDALAELARRRLAVAARDHLREAHPERWADAAPEVLAAWIDRRLARGHQLGLVEELSLLRHLEVASLEGEVLADSPDALAVLHDLERLRRWPEPMTLLTALRRSPAP